MVRRVAALDPGKTGGFAIIKDHEEIECWGFAKMTQKDIALLIKSKMSEFDICYIEKVHSMPGQGVKSMFNFGASFGQLQGILQTLSIKYELVPPATWKKVMGIQKSTDKKRVLKEKAQQLFPLNDTVHGIGVTKPEQEGAIDAILIAEYGFRIENRLCIKCKESR